MSRARYQDHAAAAAAAVSLAALCLVAAYADPTGLFAPVGAQTLRPGDVHGLWSLAGWLVFLPVLAAVAYAGTLVTVRTAAPGTGRGRVLLRVWGVCVLAGGLARFGQAVAGTVGVAVHSGSTDFLPVALWSAGLVAERTALLGWLPALVAALALRRSTPPGEPAAGQDLRSIVARTLPTALPAGLLLLGALASSSPAASISAGLTAQLPAMSAVLVTTAATALQLRGERRFAQARGIGLLVGGWVCALGAGAVVGVVDGLGTVVHEAVSGTDDLSAIPMAGQAVAAGLALGLAFGWALAPTELLLRRLPQVRTNPRTGLPLATVLVLLAVVAGNLLTATPDRTAPLSAAVRATGSQELPALTVRSRTIVDANGRQVLLRGVNVNQLNDYGTNGRSGAKRVLPLTENDFQQMAAAGFDVVRLNVNWSRLEPTRGHWSRAYLARIEQAVDWAAEYGMYTDIDMHQDAYSRYTAGAKSSACATPLPGFDGAPAWATLTDGLSRCQGLDRDTTSAVQRAASNFYHDTDGIQGHLVDTLALLARTFADNPAVAGYGLYNEPGFGDDASTSSSVLLGAYYDRALKAIRAAENATPGGFHHLAFLEPSVLWSGLGFAATPLPAFTDDPWTVFAPHLYNESITMDQTLGITLVSVERGFTLAERQAKAYGMPMWSGEWGWFPFTGKRAQSLAERFQDQADAYRMGGAFWVWKQACGSPESSTTSPTTGNYVQQDCATGDTLPPAAGVKGLVVRPYPRAVPGTLDALSSSRHTLYFSGTKAKSARSCTLDVWFPGAASPKLTVHGVTDVKSAREKGGWRITGCATGSFRVQARTGAA
ncbi:cellulase family glycosylhydrolase [Streptomyces longhuiensis]|uniref:glycoside hydrolase family 5 protein n=1 Tax=Streptomyces TaxID=1883 RepID=UPI001D0A7446|nr:cellulase family glycosylhydrolase [Streptomyces longhuiensis]UDL97126.1 glycoside hydrolase family 5 protein [Streptomyces longhuiensis]